MKDNMWWSGWEEFRNLTPDDKTNLQEQKWNQDDGEASLALRATRNRNAGRDRVERQPGIARRQAATSLRRGCTTFRAPLPLAFWLRMNVTYDLESFKP